MTGLTIIYQLRGTLDPAGVAWSQIAEKIQDIDICRFRQRRTETTGPREPGFVFVTESESMVYYSETLGSFTESSTNGELGTRYYRVLSNRQWVGMIIQAQEYEVGTLTEAQIENFYQGHPKYAIHRVLASEDHIELGQAQINGQQAEGIESHDPSVFLDPPPAVDEFVAQVWVDVQTKWPVWAEIRYIPQGSQRTITIVTDQFQWHPEVTAALFEPTIPADFQLMKKAEEIVSPLESELAFAENARQGPYLGEYKHLTLPDLRGLELLGLTPQNSPSEIHLSGHIEVWKAQDEVMRQWPAYAQVRDKLYDELIASLNIEALSPTELVTAGIALRERFWESGACLSATSYPYGYASRIVMDMAHEKVPDDMAVIDQLVESIITTEQYWRHSSDSKEKPRNPVYAGQLSELRLAQFEQIKAKVRQGLLPTWRDFVRIYDLLILVNTARKDYGLALDAVHWLIDRVELGGWMRYLDNLKWMEERFIQDRSCNSGLFLNGLGAFPEENRYGRRPPSFQGPQSRRQRLTPIHLKDPRQVTTSRVD